VLIAADQPFHRDRLVVAIAGKRPVDKHDFAIRRRSIYRLPHHYISCAPEVSLKHFIINNTP
jgi:hypothetical protein